MNIKPTERERETKWVGKQMDVCGWINKNTVINYISAIFKFEGI